MPAREQYAYVVGNPIIHTDPTRRVVWLMGYGRREGKHARGASHTTDGPEGPSIPNRDKFNRLTITGMSASAWRSNSVATRQACGRTTSREWNAEEPIPSKYVAHCRAKQAGSSRAAQNTMTVLAEHRPWAPQFSAAIDAALLRRIVGQPDARNIICQPDARAYTAPVARCGYSAPREMSLRHRTWLACSPITSQVVEVR